MKKQASDRTKEHGPVSQRIIIFFKSHIQIKCSFLHPQTKPFAQLRPFVIYPIPSSTNQPRPTLNAIHARPRTSRIPDNDAERRTRHLCVCQELIELGMTLARAAAEHALQDMAAPPPSQTIPGSAAAALAEADARLRHRAPDYGLVFARISRAVRQTVALEAHIAAARPTPAAPDPRRARLGAALRQATAIHPNRTALRREAVERLDCALAADPTAAIPIDDMLKAICQALGVTLAEPPAQPQTPAKPHTTAQSPRPRPARSPPPTPGNWRPPITQNPTG